jgi:hypothetical protein
MPAPDPIREACPLPCAERHFSFKEIAGMWHVSYHTARRRFMNEPGVLKLGSGKHVLVRVPESVLLRVYRRNGAR